MYLRRNELLRGALSVSTHCGVMTLKDDMARGESTAGSWFMYSELMKNRTAREGRGREGKKGVLCCVLMES